MYPWILVIMIGIGSPNFYLIRVPMPTKESCYNAKEQVTIDIGNGEVHPKQNNRAVCVKPPKNKRD